MYKQTMHSFTYQSYANFVDKDNRTKIRYLHCTLGQTILRHMYNIYLCRYYKQLSNKTSYAPFLKYIIARFVH